MMRSIHGLSSFTMGHLGGSPVTEDKVVAKEAIGMLQAAGDRINAGGFSISCFGHPAA
jgi:hypothetical protein